MNNVVTIPVEAIILNGNRQTVYAVDTSNRVQVRNITVGLEGSKLAEITGGLNPGDRVILGGQDKYQEGELVSPIETKEPASETVRESGGMIDMKAEQADGGSN